MPKKICNEAIYIAALQITTKAKYPGVASAFINSGRFKRPVVLFRDTEKLRRVPQLTVLPAVTIVPVHGMMLAAISVCCYFRKQKIFGRSRYDTSKSSLERGFIFGPLHAGGLPGDGA